MYRKMVKTLNLQTCNKNLHRFYKPSKILELLQNNILPNSFIELKDKMLQGTFLYLSLFLPVCGFSSLFWSVRYNAFISILLALFNEFFHGVPVTHPSKNPVWFVFHCIICTNKLENQPIDCIKSWSIISSSKPANEIVTKSLLIFNRLASSEEHFRMFLAKFVTCHV